MKKKEINRWEDLKTVSGYYPDIYSKIHYKENMYVMSCHKNIFLTEKQAKSALAFAQITQLLPHYGGYTDYDPTAHDYYINYDYTLKEFGAVSSSNFRRSQFYIKSADEVIRFIRNNEDLLRQYFMID